MPNFWGSHLQFARYFTRAIMAGHRERATEDERNTSRVTTYLLHNEMATFLHRASETALDGQLPPKHSAVLWCRVSEQQRRTLAEYRARVTQRTEPVTNGEDLRLIDRVRSLSTHPAALAPDTVSEIDLAQGPKLAVLLEIVRACQRIGDKLIVFSYDLATYRKCY